MTEGADSLQRQNDNYLGCSASVTTRSHQSFQSGPKCAKLVEELGHSSNFTNRLPNLGPKGATMTLKSTQFGRTKNFPNVKKSPVLVTVVRFTESATKLGNLATFGSTLLAEIG